MRIFWRWPSGLNHMRIGGLHEFGIDMWILNT